MTEDHKSKGGKSHLHSDGTINLSSIKIGRDSIETYSFYYAIIPTVC